MARAKHYLPGHIWHITHRCHKQEFLFKFARDQKRMLGWLFQAKKTVWSGKRENQRENQLDKTVWSGQTIFKDGRF